MTRGKRKQCQRSRTSRTMSIEPLMNRELLAADLAGATEGDTSNHTDDIVNAFTERIDNSVAEVNDGELLSHELLRVEQQKVSSAAWNASSSAISKKEKVETDANQLLETSNATADEYADRGGQGNASAIFEQSAGLLTAAAESLASDAGSILTATREALATADDVEKRLTEAETKASATVEDASRGLATAADHAAEVLSTDADPLDQRLEALECEISQRAAPEAPTLAPVWLDANGNLIVLGTPAGDTIEFHGNDNGTISVVLNDQIFGEFKVDGNLIAFGFAGDDSISTVRNVIHQVEFFGGAGDDKLSTLSIRSDIPPRGCASG